MNYSTLDWKVERRLLKLTLNRPEHLNAFTVTMASELEHAFNRASLDDDIDVILVTGAGSAFCAGMDLSVKGNVFGLDERLSPSLNDLSENLNSPAICEGVRDTGGKVSLAIYECRKPVVGAINGAAIGVGATMTLAMDFRLASEDARFGFVFGRLGIVPEACSTWFLPRIVGLTQALEWIYTAEILDARAALEGRLVRSVHPSDTFLDEAEAFARSLVVGRSPMATALSRQLLHRSGEHSHPLEAHHVESLAMFYSSIADGQEGVAAFLEKRTPRFSCKASSLPPFFTEWTATHSSDLP